MRTRIIHLVNPKTDSITTRPLYLNRALYSPLAGLLAVAATIPRDRYEVVLTDENIETVDFDLKADLVGISAMTSYVNRGYEIADAFRARGIPVVMGGVHPSFMPQEALKHADAVVHRRGRVRDPEAARRPRAGTGAAASTGRTGSTRWKAWRCRATTCSRSIATSTARSCRPPAAATRAAPSAPSP